MKKHLRLLLALLAAFTLVAAACSDDDDSGSDDSDAAESIEGTTVTIGAQDFGESAILAELYGQGLADAGYSTEIQELGGFRDLEIPAFENGEINFAPEYVASMLEFLNEGAGEATSDVDETKGLLDDALAEVGLVAFEPADAIDTNTFAVTQETADELGLETLSDLADHEDLTLGGPQDCETNPFCIPGLQEVYDVDLSGSFTPLDAGLVADALESGDIDVGVVFSTAGVIADQGLVVLEDDMGMLAADNIVPVATEELADEYGEDFADRVNEISAALTTEALTEMNARFDIEAEDADVIATDFLEEEGLVG